MTPDAVRGLVSLFLAAGNLTAYRSPNGERAQAALTGGQRDAAYLAEKVAQFKEHIPSKAEVIPYYPMREKRKGGPQILRFRCTTTRLMPIYHLLYPGRRRYITSAALELCGGRAAALLIAEHGKRTPDGLRIWSAADSREEIIRIAQWLQTLTGVDCSLHMAGARKNVIIQLAPDQAAKACEILVPYAPISRKNLFLLCMNDVNPVFEASDLLLPGQGETLAPRRKIKAVARTAAH